MVLGPWRLFFSRSQTAATLTSPRQEEESVEGYDLIGLAQGVCVKGVVHGVPIMKWTWSDAILSPGDWKKDEERA